MAGCIAIAVAIVVILIPIIIYNRLIALEQTRQDAFADIDVQLKQRCDLIPNLVETVKGNWGRENR
jgi:LemA protein